jgi:hypothetical protein
MDEDFFRQFLLTPPVPADIGEEKLKRPINVIAKIYDEMAGRNNIESSFLSFRRPIYMVITLTDMGTFVLYTNEKAVRGSSTWWFLDLRGSGLLHNPYEQLSLIARRDVGLEEWKGFHIPLNALDVEDENSLKELLQETATELFNQDLAGELNRRRIVQINPMFTGRNFLVQPNLCFVLMPFRQELTPIYDDHIKKIVEEVNLECKRADDIFSNTAIIEDIWANINKARLLIADLTGKNPNVFYEVGVAHTIGKDVILTTQNIDDVPFDLRHLRHIQYEYTPRGMEAFEQHLKNTIISILSRPV